jgi:hypothetical protein
MSRLRRNLLLAIVAVVVLYGLSVVIWAAQPLEDSVPVGVDYTLDPPAGRRVSQEVECNTLLSSSARDSSPLPTLKAQPATAPELGYQRAPCIAVQEDARKIFALNTLVALAAIVALGMFALRHRSLEPPPPVLL